MLPVAASVALGLAACTLSDDVADAQAEQVYGRTWIAKEVAGQPVAAGIQSSLVVESNGKVTGHAGCNGYFGSVIIDGGAMSFGNLGATRMACPEPAMSQEARLLRALDSTRGYRLLGNDLMLLDGTGSTLVRFHDEEAGA